MKKLVLAAAILAASAASTFAADMAARPYTKAPLAPPILTYDWSGIYVGGAVGGAWHDTEGDLYNAPGFFWRTDSESRLIYGGFAGIQKQWGNFVLGIEGGWVLEGELPGSEGGVQRQRITWTPGADGTVTQHWETSDDGVTWTTSFLGLYRPAEGSAPPP